jgi:hypothetical protein
VEPVLRELLVRPVGGLTTGASERREPSTSYQPGARDAPEPTGLPAFFAGVEARRYTLERSPVSRRLGRRAGWHLWSSAVK